MSDKGELSGNCLASSAPLRGVQDLACPQQVALYVARKMADIHGEDFGSDCSTSSA